MGAVRTARRQPPPLWLQPERYTTTDTAIVPRVTDGRLNVLSGATAGGDVIPGNVIRHPFATNNGYQADGQSNDTGKEAQPGDSALTSPYVVKMFDGGLRAAPVGNAYSASVTGVTSLVDIAEADTGQFGFTDEGETHVTTAMKVLNDLALSQNGVAVGDTAWIAANNGKSGTAIALRSQGATLWTYMTDQARAQRALGGSGWAQRARANFDNESDALNGTTYAAFKSSLVNSVAIPAHDFARQISGQIHPVFTLTWQASYKIATNNGPALAQYDAALECPLVCQLGPMWHLPRVGDHLHLSKTAQIWWGYYVGRALKQLLFDGRRPDCIRMLSARYDAGLIKIAYSVPTLPLVIDATIGAANGATGAPTQNGYKMTDSLGNIALSDFEVSPGGDEIWCTPASAPVGAWTVRAGLDYSCPDIAITDSAECCVRDSTTDTCTISAVVYPLYHLVPHYEVAGQ